MMGYGGSFCHPEYSIENMQIRFLNIIGLIEAESKFQQQTLYAEPCTLKYSSRKVIDVCGRLCKMKLNKK